MRFNICYFGPERILNLRRDFFLALKYGLEDLGHEVFLSNGRMYSDAKNILVGAYFLSAEKMKHIAESKLSYIAINTEIVKNDVLNFNSDKTDFLGGYLPFMQAAEISLDTVWENIEECETQYGLRSKFLRWGFHPKLEDVDHKAKKDLHFYFFGSASKRRERIIKMLISKGFKGYVDWSCPYFIRNDNIARAKVHLNIVQDDKYSHVNGFRICYLANNKCAILSEREEDGAGYLDLAAISDEADYVSALANLISRDAWKQQAESSYELFRKTSMAECIERVLDEGQASATG